MSERVRDLLSRVIARGAWASPAEWKAWREEYAALPKPMSPGWPYDATPHSEPVAREEYPLAHLEENPALRFSGVLNR